MELKIETGININMEISMNTANTKFEISTTAHQMPIFVITPKSVADVDRCILIQ